MFQLNKQDTECVFRNVTMTTHPEDGTLSVMVVSRLQWIQNVFHYINGSWKNNLLFSLKKKLKKKNQQQFNLKTNFWNYQNLSGLRCTETINITLCKTLLLTKEVIRCRAPGFHQVLLNKLWSADMSGWFRPPTLLYSTRMSPVQRSQQLKVMFS